jgi:hypothetical protein
MTCASVLSTSRSDLVVNESDGLRRALLGSRMNNPTHFFQTIIRIKSTLFPGTKGVADLGFQILSSFVENGAEIAEVLEAVGGTLRDIFDGVFEVGDALLKIFEPSRGAAGSGRWGGHVDNVMEICGALGQERHKVTPGTNPGRKDKETL